MNAVTESPASVSRQIAAVASLDPGKVLQLVIQLAEATDASQALRQQLTLRDQSIAALTAEVASLQEAVRAAQSDVEQLADVAAREQKWRTKYQRCKAQLATDEASHRDAMEAMRRSVAELTSENAALRDSVQTLSVTCTTTLEVAEKRASEEQQRLKELDLDRQRMTGRLRQAESSAADLSQRVVQLERELLDVRTAALVRRPSCSVAVSTGDTGCRSHSCQVMPECRTVGIQAFAEAADAPDREDRAIAETMAPRRDTRGSWGSAGRHDGMHPLRCALLQYSEDAVDAMVQEGELLQRRHIERQLKIHDRLLATVSGLQREAWRHAAGPAVRAPPPAPF